MIVIFMRVFFAIYLVIQEYLVLQRQGECLGVAQETRWQQPSSTKIMRTAYLLRTHRL